VTAVPVIWLNGMPRMPRAARQESAQAGLSQISRTGPESATVGQRSSSVLLMK